MKCVDDFRLKFGKQELVPIMIGGMGVDISTAELALEAVRLGGIGHISDAMVPDVSDRRFDTSFVKDKTRFYKHNIDKSDKSIIKFDLGAAGDVLHDAGLTIGLALVLGSYLLQGRTLFRFVDGVAFAAVVLLEQRRRRIGVRCDGLGRKSSQRRDGEGRCEFCQFHFKAFRVTVFNSLRQPQANPRLLG